MTPLRSRLLCTLGVAWTLAGASLVHAAVPAPCDKMVQGIGAPKYRGTKPAGTTLCRLGYVLTHNSDRRTPDWVLEVLTPERFQGPGDRDNSDFHPDPDLAAKGLPHAELADYKKSGYQRGHMAPAADMSFSQDAMDESFYLSNMVPQNGSLNGGVWGRLEDQTRTWARTRKRIIVVSGPIYADDNGKTIGGGEVAVPTAVYKIAYDPDRHRAIGFIFPNKAQRGRKAEEFIVPIRDIEDLTGLNFFPDLPAREQSQIESVAATIWR